MCCAPRNPNEGEAMTTELALRIDEKKIAELEQAVDSCSATWMAEGAGRVHKALSLAAGIARLRDLLTSDVMAEIMRLQGSPIGFRTDKDTDHGYPEAVVKECIIEALIRGLYPVGNEFNIIASRFYCTKEGLSRLVREFPTLTDLELDIGVPANKSGGVVVSCAAKWKLGGKPCELACDIPIRVNQGMIVDAIVGKAERKLLNRVYKRVTGSEMSDGDAAEAGRSGAAGDGDKAENLAKRLAPGTEVVAESDAQAVAEQTDPKPAEQAEPRPTPTGPAASTSKNGPPSSTTDSVQTPLGDKGEASDADKRFDELAQFIAIKADIQLADADQLADTWLKNLKFNRADLADAGRWRIVWSKAQRVEWAKYTATAAA